MSEMTALSTMAIDESMGFLRRRASDVMLMNAATGTIMKMDFSVPRVMISYLISILGAYMCTCACEQLRVSYIVGTGNFYNDLKWFIMMGLSIGAIGIWSMHFIGMSALTLVDKGGEIVPMSFHVGISAASLIVVIITTVLGVMIAANDPMFMKTKQEILEMFLKDTAKLSMAEVRQMKNTKLLQVITTKNLEFLVAGGVVAGSGVSIMHFIGMEAMHFHGHIDWNAGIVALAVCIAIIASTAAFWILFRLLSLFPSKEFLRVASALIMGIAVCGMHYTGMVAAEFKLQSGYPPQTSSVYMLREDAYTPVILAVIFSLVIMTIIVLSDLRRTVNKFNSTVKRIVNPDWKASQDESSMIYASKFNPFRYLPSGRRSQQVSETSPRVSHTSKNSSSSAHPNGKKYATTVVVPTIEQSNLAEEEPINEEEDNHSMHSVDA